MDHYPAYTNGRLDAQADALLTAIAAEGPAPTAALTPEQARASFLRPSWLGTPREMAAVRDLSIPGPAGSLRLRTYLPHGGRPLPVLVFFHGGGFVVGSLDEFDAFCTCLADGAGSLVVSVDYRLAPEWKFPAASEDAIAALRWVAAHAREIDGDPSRIAVAGDSAGGNLAAVAALAARDEGGPALVKQVLVSPWVDLSCAETESFRHFGQGGWLSTTSLRWYRDHYLASPEDSLHPHASPILVPDLRGLPPALILDSEFDILHDQVRAFAMRLRDAGNAVDDRLCRGQLHDFVVLPGLFDEATRAIAEICESLRRSFRR
ncbi:MAG: alpha/beta hydrolase [Thermoanaerobaculia bacterium]